MKKFLALPTLVISAVLAVLLGTPSVTMAAEVNAKKLFTATHKCNMCHAVPAAGIEAKSTTAKMKGADLGGKVRGDFETIAAYVRKTVALDGKKHKKEFKGTDEELQTIIDWLGSLEAEE